MSIRTAPLLFGDAQFRFQTKPGQTVTGEESEALYHILSRSNSSLTTSARQQGINTQEGNLETPSLNISKWNQI